MPALRRRRFAIVLFTLFSLVFMQLALAAYSCPGVASRVQEAAAMAQAGMPCADAMPMAMDEEQPSLCHAHCQAGDQASDNHPLQLPPIALPGALTHQISFTGALTHSARGAPLPASRGAPPLAIRNCCLRI